MGRALPSARTGARSEAIRFFHIYGVPVGSDGIATIHVERVRDRHALHGGRVELHRHPHLYQFSLWHGGGSYEIDGIRQPLGNHALTIMPATVSHGFDIGSDADADAVVVSLSAAYAGALRLDDDGVPWSVIDRPALLDLDSVTHHRFSALFEAIEEEHRRPRAHCREAVAALLRLLVIALARLRNSDRQDAGNKLIDSFLALLDARLHDRWSIESYVAALGTSIYRLNVATRESFGRSAMELVRERLTAEAQRLLLFSKMSAGEVGATLGFDDPAHFGRFFQRQTGQSPAAWRREQTDSAKAG